MALTRRTLFGATALIAADHLPSLVGSAQAEALDVRLRDKLWTSYYGGTRVWGYVGRHSVKPGETFDLMLSSGPNAGPRRGTVEIYRIGAYAGSDRKLMASFEDISVDTEAISLSASATGLGWPKGVDTIDTTDWPSGYYTIDFIDAQDGSRDLNVAYVIVRPVDPKLDILVLFSTNTYQAYNAWGGASLYESVTDPARGGYMVSFDRPTPPDMFEYEYFLVQWLEKIAAARGWSVGYATNYDVHSDLDLVTKPRLFLSGSHNEYWSKEEFDHVFHRIHELGRNTIFFGANSAYWQVRYKDVNRPDGGVNEGRQIVCFKTVNDPIATRLNTDQAALLRTAMFRDDARRPETMLAGVAYQSYFPAGSTSRYPYRVARTDLPFFEGTGLKVGDTIADVVGYEWDNRDPEGDGQRLFDPKRSKIPLLDQSRLQVLFEGSPVDLNGKPGKAEAVYFVSPAGAHVFSTGSIRWAWGLGKPGFVSAPFQRFNENLFAHMVAT